MPLRDFGSADGLRDVEAVEEHLVFYARAGEMRRNGLQFDLRASSEFFELSFRTEGRAGSLQRFEGKCTVHRAAIEIEIAKDLGDALRNAALARAGWAVNGDGEFGTEIFKNP